MHLPDWSLTDEESVGEESDLDNRGQETRSLTHVYSLHVSALKHGYKGFFVKARATPAFNQTFGLRLWGELKLWCALTDSRHKDKKKKKILQFQYQ